MVFTSLYGINRRTQICEQTSHPSMGLPAFGRSQSMMLRYRAGLCVSALSLFCRCQLDCYSVHVVRLCLIALLLDTLQYKRLWSVSGVMHTGSCSLSAVLPYKYIQGAVECQVGKPEEASRSSRVLPHTESSCKDMFA
jgi:hypothetical protein